MSEQDYGVDPELVQEFVDESNELLGDVTNLFITLESNPDDRESIDKIFRAVHTIKGNSAFFNLMKVKSMAHIMEDLMNLVRDGSLKFSDVISDVLIRGIDCLKEMLENVRNSAAEVNDEEAYSLLLAEITQHVQEAKGSDPTAVWKMIVADLEKFQSVFKSEDVKTTDLFKKIVANLEIVSPLTGKLGKEEAPTEAPASGKDPKSLIEDICSRDFGENLDEKQSAQVFQALEALKGLADEKSLPAVLEAQQSYQAMVETDGFTPFLAEVILEKVKHVSLKQVQKEEHKEADTSDGEAKKGDASSSAKSNKTMRVYESAIDTFLDFVGELVVVGEMYDHILKRFGEECGGSKTVADLKKNNETFNDLSTALQRSVLDIRRVPIKTLVQRAPRIIRDVATMKNKKIRVNIQGDDTLIDKSLLESLEGPFVHMVRNAADHGVEVPDKRKAAGKSEEGNVLIDIVENDEAMFIKIKDDGGGINKDFIKSKAVEKHIITNDQAQRLEDYEVYNLLFAPGFSTAEQVTDISGRGVGMDVVKRNIEAMGGQILIESDLGSGSTFTLQIPKAVAVKIMEGFLVSSSGHRFVLPMLSVGESFKVSEEHITTTPQKGECIMHHGVVYSVLRLDKRLDLRPLPQEDEEKVGVMLDVGKKKIVLLVDDVLGTQQVVIKDIQGLPGQSGLIAGGAVLGDERVAIVLNVEEI